MYSAHFSRIYILSRSPLTQVKVVHAIGHEDVMEQDEAWVIDALVEPVGPIRSVHVLL